MTNRHLTKVFILVGFSCGLVNGAQLPDLAARLEKLDGKNTICGAVHIEDRTSKKEDLDGKPLEKADFTITADANALTVAVAGKISDSRVFREFSVLRSPCSGPQSSRSMVRAWLVSWMGSSSPRIAPACIRV